MIKSSLTQPISNPESWRLKSGRWTRMNLSGGWTGSRCHFNLYYSIGRYLLLRCRCLSTHHRYLWPWLRTIKQLRMKRDSWWLRNGRKRLVLLPQHGNPGSSMLWEYNIWRHLQCPICWWNLHKAAAVSRQLVSNWFPCVCRVSMGLLQVRGIQDSLRAMFNPHFGSTFRSHNNPTYFSRKLFRSLTQFNILTWKETN